MPDLSHVCNLHHTSQQHWILNPLREARDQIHNLMVPSWMHFCCTTMGTPPSSIFKASNVGLSVSHATIFLVLSLSSLTSPHSQSLYGILLLVCTFNVRLSLTLIFSFDLSAFSLLTFLPTLGHFIPYHGFSYPLIVRDS